MRYAKVVFGLPVEGPFDYLLPDKFSKKIKVGSRVRVSFRNQRKVGYVVSLSRKTKIKNIKPVSEIIDEFPILSKNILSLAKELSDYYCCSLGEAIEAAIPERLRKGKVIPLTSDVGYLKKKDKPEAILLHSLDNQIKWDMFIKEIKATLDSQKSAIILLSDIDSVLRAAEIIKARLGAQAGILYRKQPNELNEWQKTKEGRVNIIIGTRSGIFAPVNNLGLLIIDEEQNSVYKQEQVPHYHAKEVAFMRSDIERSKLILSSTHPSLESFYLAQKNKINPSTALRIDAERSRGIKYLLIPRKKAFPEIKIINMSGLPARIILSKYLESAIITNLNSSGKTLLFINRKGFATFTWCRKCGLILKCSRCNINLVYHFKDNILNCHYCNFRLEPPKVCPNCNSDYIRYSGTGTESIESELSRLFPRARIARKDKPGSLDIKEADIFISTASIIKEIDCNFDLIGVLSIDNSLNRLDFRAAEKTSGLLTGLLGLTDKKLVIQTRLPNHYCFSSLLNKDSKLFYTEELKLRKELGFPPFKHLALVKLRGRDEDKVKKISLDSFNKLKSKSEDTNINIVCANPGQPSKLRGNYYWNILLKAKDAKIISRFLKKHLKNLSHSGIIVTVDIDPI